MPLPTPHLRPVRGATKCDVSMPQIYQVLSDQIASVFLVAANTRNIGCNTGRRCSKDHNPLPLFLKLFSQRKQFASYQNVPQGASAWKRNGRLGIEKPADLEKRWPRWWYCPLPYPQQNQSDLPSGHWCQPRFFRQRRFQPDDAIRYDLRGAVRPEPSEQPDQRR